VNTDVEGRSVKSKKVAMIDVKNMLKFGIGRINCDALYFE
jgi:hypothetical protein